MEYLKCFFKTEDSISSLVLRVALGVAMFPHGAQKLLGWFGGPGLEATLGFFTSTMGIPYFIAILVVIGEFFGALGLITGFLTRFCAASIAIIMAGAVPMFTWSNGFFMNWSGKQAGEGFEYQILAIGIAVALVISGGGSFSIDQWVSRNLLQKKS
ncbi:Membrane protein 2, distant similarity to thiosulphate:quinone oxidoreductase DoxD [hydrothermal vent metagenome]|uniref:Membrane protein 2, distant similarity to thiosulphate:quinone oxidoreductase DoxD n=1 Tax=hydrothermal vent metagenome TaxID=652676 RepID=A0A3B1DCE3_9ZZZZ